MRTRCIMYSTPACGKCSMLEFKLNEKGIEFCKNTNLNQMEELGINSVPVLDIGDGKLLDFHEAIDWLNS